MSEIRLLPSPWSRAPQRELSGKISERPCVLLPSRIGRVRTGVRGLDLPLVGSRVLDGSRWNVFELLGAGRESAGSEAVVLESGDGLERTSVQLDGGIEFPTNEETEEDRSTGGERVRAFLGDHVELVYWPIEQQQRLVDGCASVDLRGLFEHWRESRESEDARIALIVRLAREVGGVVKSIGERPRRVLRRRRDMERVGAVRQIDPAGIRWLVRQPGRNLAERAGPRQRVLAVVREETHDTHENRVFRDLLDRCAVECRVWLKENRSFAGSERHKGVAHYASLTRRLRQAGALAAIRPVMGPAEPNYVLQHDERYSRVWPWYQKLRRRQEEEDRLWRWNHRTFAESIRLALAWTIDELEEAADFPPAAGYVRRLLVREEQSYGAFVDSRSQFAGWMIQAQDGDLLGVSLLSDSSIRAFEERFAPGSSISSLAPDALVVVHDPFDPGRVRGALAVWARLRLGGGGVPAMEAEAIARSISEVGAHFPCDAVVIEVEGDASSTGQLLGTDKVRTPEGRDVRVHSMECPLPPDGAREQFRALIETTARGVEG